MFSLNDIKLQCHNELLLERFISIFGINPELEKINEKSNDSLSLERLLLRFVSEVLLYKRLDMLVGILLYIVWPLTFVSFLIVWLYRKDRVITTLNKNSSNILTDYLKIRKIGKVTIIVALVYYIIFCGILGWETSSLAFSYGIILFSILIVDWFLVAVTYKKSENKRLFGISVFWLSVFYKISRIVYIISVVTFMVLAVKGGPYLIVAVAKDILTYLPDMTIESIKQKFSEDPTVSLNFFKKYKLKFRVENEFERFNSKRIYTVEANHSFRDGYVIVNYNSPEFHIYNTHFYLFKEYLYTVRGNADPKDGTFKIYNSPNRDTIYIGRQVKISNQNYISNDNGLYIHTIVRDGHSESIEMNKL